MCRQKEIEWFYQSGASYIFPELWKPYEELIEPSKRQNMVKAYHELLTHENYDVRLKAARVWSEWEAGTSHLYYDQEAVNHYFDPHIALAFARIECHYFINNAFFDSDDYLLKQVPKFKDVPGWIVQGRYDIVCPATSAVELHEAWPNSDLRMIQDAGHSISEPGIQKELVKIMEELKARFK